MLSFTRGPAAASAAGTSASTARVGMRGEIVIEADHSVHFGAGQFQRMGNLRLCVGIDTAKFRLNCMQQGQQAAQ